MAGSSHVPTLPKSLEYWLGAYSQLSNSRDGAVRTHVWNSIDGDLLAIDAFRPSLCACRNEYIFAYSLPFEVLSAIFRLLVDAWPPKDGHSLGWINITHVCRRWRNVACEDAALWAAAIVRFPLKGQWLSEMIARTRSLPLRFELVNLEEEEDQPGFVEIKSLLRTHMYHIRYLRLEVTYTEHMADLVAALTAAAPFLETVILHSFFNFNLVLSPDAFSIHLPRLRVFHLEGLKFHWNPNAFNTRNLEDLSIGLEEDPDGFPLPSLRSLTSFFPALSNVKMLRLGGLPRSSEGFQPTSPANLPRLTQLHIQGTVAGCTAVLDALRLSPLCALSIDCYICIPETAAQFIPILSRMGTHLCRDSKLSPIQTFAAESHGVPSLYLCGWRGVSKNMRLPSTPDTADAAFCLRLYLMHDLSHPLQVDTSDLWRLISASLPLQDTRIFSFRSCDYSTSTDLERIMNKDWAGILAPFSAVSHCYICAPLPVNSLDLPLVLSRSLSRDPLRLSLPSLTLLHVEHDSARSDAGDSPCSQWASYQKLLFEALDERKKSGFGIQELSLQAWVVDVGCEEQLRLVVPNVELTDCELMEDPCTCGDSAEGFTSISLHRVASVSPTELCSNLLPAR